MENKLTLQDAATIRVQNAAHKALLREAKELLLDNGYRVSESNIDAGYRTLLRTFRKRIPTNIPEGIRRDLEVGFRALVRWNYKVKSLKNLTPLQSENAAFLITPYLHMTRREEVRDI